MANDKTYDRHINIWINGKEVENSLSAIRKEMLNVSNARAKMDTGSDDFKKATYDINKLNGILAENSARVKKSAGSWDELKEKIGGSIGKLSAVGAAAYGAFEAVKGILLSTEGSKDKLNEIIAGSKEVFWQFQNAMSNLDFGNFFSNMREAWNRGKDLEQQLDNLVDRKAYNDYIIASKNRESRALQETIKNVELDISVRNDAAEKRKIIEQEIYDRTVLLAKRSFTIEKDTWEGRNKMAAEEAVKLYEVIDKISEEDQNKLEQAFKAAVEGQLGDVNQGIKSVLFGQSGAELLKGMDPEVIKSYGDYFRLLQKGEAEVLPKLFNAFKNIDEAAAEAQQRLNTVIREGSNLGLKESRAADKLNKGSGQSGLGDTTGLENVIANAFQNPAYNADEYIKAESEKILAHEKEVNAEKLKDFEETEKKKTEALVKAGEEGKQEAIKKWNEIQINDKENLEKMVNAYTDFGARVGEEIGSAIAEGTMSAKEGAKQLIMYALDELGNYATIAIAKATIGSLTTPDSIATFGVSGAIRAAVLTGLIKAALGAVKGIISKKMYDGGYAESGGKYEPAGIFHKGEYIVNADMVASPVTGPIVQALEAYRQNGMQDYANGGGPGVSVSGYGAAGSSSTLIGTDPELKYILKSVGRLLTKLDRNGVKTNFTYKDVDTMRQGISRLQDNEDDVTM